MTRAVLEQVFYDAGVTEPTWTDAEGAGSGPGTSEAPQGGFAAHLANSARQSDGEQSDHSLVPVGQESGSPVAASVAGQPGKPEPSRRRRRPVPYGNALTSASPFQRLAATHAFSVAGDTLFTIALANSIFFSTDPDQARFKVALSLALTMAPFAIVSPFLGPLLDRFAGGRKAMMIGSLVLRGLICLMLAGIVEDSSNLGLYPLAFMALVLSKSYAVSKSSLVPSAVSRDDDLVLANARLAIIAGVFGTIALAPGGLLTWIGGGDWVLRFAVLVYIVGALMSLRVVQRPVVRGLLDPGIPTRSSAVITAAVAMSAMRFVVGFLAFLIAFEYREDGALIIGLALGSSALGTFVGNFVVPKFSDEVAKERIIEVCLGITAAAGLFGALASGWLSAVLLAFGCGMTAAGTRLAFDALVQRDCPDELRARFFAKFEAAFQIAWVVGAIVPVVINFSLAAGFVVIIVVVVTLGSAYVLGRRRIEQRAAVGESVDATLVGAYPEIEQVRRGIGQAIARARAQQRERKRASQHVDELHAELDQKIWAVSASSQGLHALEDDTEDVEPVKTLEQRSLFEPGSSAQTSPNED
jgi:MFS family permease